jgi:ribosome assembly protein RRB1
LGDEFNNDDNNKDDDDDDDKDESSDEEEEDLDPVLEHYSMRHDGGVNRIRSMPQNPNIIATWSDVGMVNLYDTQGILDLFNGTSSNNNKRGSSSFRKDPFFVYSGHATEGFAMDWSNTKEGNLATGDCQGNIHVWNVADAISTTSSWNQSSFGVQSYYAPSSNVEESPSSVEDIQWSPTEATVLATAQDDGCVKIYDTRAPNRFMISQLVGGSSSNTTNNGVDVNVLSWNAQVANLLATGSDDGGLAVWDLRQFSASIPKPLARFTCHSTPITSVEWHPTDESMLLVTDENATYIYDLSIEEDDVPKNKTLADSNPNVDDIPPQLLFVHCGSTSTKEAHWHPQITSLVMTTALSGFNVFIPSNL